MPDSWTPKLICSEVATALREARQKQGLSMNVLAQRSGLSLTMISYVERQLRNPTLDTLLRIARVLEVDVGAVIQKANQAQDASTKKGRYARHP